jgi:uncharacterized protein (TIGR00297 family)
MTDFLIGFLLSALVGVGAYKKKSLSESGVLAALILGTLLYGFAGWQSYLILMVFFILSSFISKFNPDRVSSRRTYVQVLANALVATGFGFIYFLTNNIDFLIVSVGSIAVSASDTWSSEIGRLSKHNPRHIFTFKVMGRGLSGGVSLLGFLASLLASTVFALLTLIITRNPLYIIGVFVAAFLGSIIDSMLGTIQIKYKDTVTGVLTEKPNLNTTYYSGFKWISNNTVNFSANIVTSLLLLFYLLNH